MRLLPGLGKPLSEIADYRVSLKELDVLVKSGLLMNEFSGAIYRL